MHACLTAGIAYKSTSSWQVTLRHVRRSHSWVPTREPATLDKWRCTRTSPSCALGLKASQSGARQAWQSGISLQAVFMFSQ